MKILGLDVCKNRVVGWLLSEWPPNLKEHWRTHHQERSKDPNKDFLTFYHNAAGMSRLVQLKPDVIVLEPTGVHYSKLVATVCEKEGIEVLWVGHREVRNYRTSNRLPNKNDIADALALAAYGFLHYGKSEFFLTKPNPETVRLREVYLELNSLSRIQSPIINRLRQQLAHEFPEAALKKTEVSSDGLAPLWAWLAERERGLKRSNYYYDRLYEKSVAKIYGIGISDFTSYLANTLCDLHLQERTLCEELELLLNDPLFASYMKVLRKFQITGRLAGLIISQVYPIENFPTLGGFKKRLGYGQEEKSSGDSVSEHTGGSSQMTRTAIFLWVNYAIAPSTAPVSTPQLRKITEYYDRKKAKFSEDPDAWSDYLIKRKAEQIVKSFAHNFRETFLPLVDKSKADLVEMQTAMMARILAESLSKPVLPLKKSEVAKGFGVLIHSQTAAYACKILYRELRKAICGK